MILKGTVELERDGAELFLEVRPHRIRAAFVLFAHLQRERGHAFRLPGSHGETMILSSPRPRSIMGLPQRWVPSSAFWWHRQHSAKLGEEERERGVSGRSACLAAGPASSPPSPFPTAFRLAGISARKVAPESAVCERRVPKSGRVA